MFITYTYLYLMQPGIPLFQGNEVMEGHYIKHPNTLWFTLQTAWTINIIKFEYLNIVTVGFCFGNFDEKHQKNIFHNLWFYAWFPIKSPKYFPNAMSSDEINIDSI